MNALIEAVVSRPRPVLLILVMLIVAGITSYITIPKEAEPDIVIPQMYVNIVHEGISPEDAERLLIRPMETELRTLEGLKELRATASEGVAAINLEFDAGFEQDAEDVRRAAEFTGDVDGRRNARHGPPSRRDQELGGLCHGQRSQIQGRKPGFRIRQGVATGDEQASGACA